MAYRFFGSEHLEGRLPGPISIDVHAPSILRQPFSRLERTVIALAMRAPRTGEGGNSWVSRAMRFLLGIERSTPLADPRLEALRRYVALVRHRPGKVTPQDEERFVAAGFSSSQARLIRSDLLVAHEWRGVPGQA
jgi:hypothetical protein